MWLLNYLLGISSRVITLFSSYYFRVINAARFAFSWAVREADKAFNRAKAKAIALFNIAKVVASLALSVAKSFILRQIALAKAKAIALFNIATVAASLATSILRGFLLGQIGSVRAFVSREVERAKATLKLFVDARILDRIGGLFDLIPLVRFIKDLRALLSAENLAKLNTLLKDKFQTLTLIVNNPVGFLVAFWRTFMLTFLDFALGYALGTTNRELPPWPSFGNGGGGPFPSPGPGPAPLPGELVSPLPRLRISGHRFTPGHLGLDLGCTQQDAVFAMHNGIIETARFSSVGYGFNVTIRGGPWWTRYAHLKAEGLRPIGAVSAGQVIGICDNTGNSSGDHLHLEIKKHGRFVDPVPLLGLS